MSDTSMTVVWGQAAAACTALRLGDSLRAIDFALQHVVANSSLLSTRSLATAHGGGHIETAVRVALAAASAAHELDRDRFLLYFGLIVAALSDAARKAFLMHPQGTQFFDESQRESFDRGRAAEKAADVLDVLKARGLMVTEAQRERVLGCTDLEILSRWLRRAATITSADALFD